MKKMYGAIILGIIIILLVIFYGVKKLTNKPDDKPISKKEDLYEITIKKTAGIPFKWEYEIEDEEVLQYVKAYVLRDDNEKNHTTGGNVYVNYCFKGLKEGKTKVTFKEVSIENENDISEKLEYTLKVDNNLKVTEVK